MNEFTITSDDMNIQKLENAIDDKRRDVNTLRVTFKVLEAEIEKVKTLEALNGDNATVTVEFPYQYKLQYSLSKQNDKWLIDEIKNISAN